VVAAWAALWPIVINTLGGVEAVPARLHEVAAVFRLSGARRIRSIVLPAAAPLILVGARLGLSFALIVAVVAEMIGRYPRELATGVLPDRSLLRLVMGGASVPAGDTVPVALPVGNPDLTGDAPSMELKGTYWHVVFNGEKAVVRDRKGFAYISRLLKAPDREVGASLLASGGIGEVASMAEVVEAGLTVGSTFDEVLTLEDEKYLRTHIDFLRVKRNKTEDPGRQSDIDLEIEQVESYIAKTRGRGGRPRTFPDNDERARASVKRAIDRALAELAVHLPALREHLRDSIHTGRRVTYAPRPPVHWDIAA